MIGERHHWLTVIGTSDRLDSEGKLTFVVVRCECGDEKVVSRKNFRCGGTKSCGCQKKRMQRAASTTHGKSKTPEFRAWQRIVSRCYSHKDDAFPDYGGRGITVCDRWRFGDGQRGGFECFLADVGPKPFKWWSIDRIDNDGHYEPDNVRWATPTEQNRNKRDNHIVEFRGHRMTQSEAAAVCGMTDAAMNYRLKRWPLEKAITRKPQPVGWRTSQRSRWRNRMDDPKT